MQFLLCSALERAILASRLAGLVARHQGRKVRPDAAKLEARILEWTRRGPQDGTTHWSSRRLAAALGTHHMTVARVWARHGLQPHRLRRYMLSEDPDFEKKAADIIGLYLNPPDHAAVFCVDEKTAIQALDRLDPVLPLSPGRAEAHGFEYYRHGTLSLYAALDTRSGEVLGKTAPRHTSAEFVDFLVQVVASQPRAREIHVIADNLSAHKTTLVDDFLAQHPQVRIHFTPTYSSWLNQVEIWFAKIQRQVIARGIFSPWTISAEKSFVTSGTTTKPLPLSDGLSRHLPTESIRSSFICYVIINLLMRQQKYRRRMNHPIWRALTRLLGTPARDSGDQS